MFDQVATLAIWMNHSHGLMCPAQILENDVGAGGREIVATETLRDCITANYPRRAFTEEHRQQP